MDIRIPKAVTSLLHWSTYRWSAYKLLTDDTKVMSVRQVAIFLGQQQKDIIHFVSRNQLETIYAQIPNGVVINTYPLPTIAAYLNYLLNRNLQSQHRLTLAPEEWSDLINTFLHPEKEAINSYYFNYSCENIDAFPLNIELDSQINLEILLTNNGEYRIGCSEGLKCIKVSPLWLGDNSEKKAKLLSKLKISREVRGCRVFASPCVKQIDSLSYSDWLTIWEYFANNGNKLAISALKACALESIASRAKKISLHHNRKTYKFFAAQKL